MYISSTHGSPAVVIYDQGTFVVRLSHSPFVGCVIMFFPSAHIVSDVVEVDESGFIITKPEHTGDVVCSERERHSIIKMICICLTWGLIIWLIQQFELILRMRHFQPMTNILNNAWIVKYKHLIKHIYWWRLWSW